MSNAFVSVMSQLFECPVNIRCRTKGLLFVDVVVVIKGSVYFCKLYLRKRYYKTTGRYQI